MPKTPRLDAIEAHLAELNEQVGELQDTVATLIPVDPVDPVDVPDPDGTTPRQKWTKGVQEVIADAATRLGETIDSDEANARLINLLNSMSKPGEV